MWTLGHCQHHQNRQFLRNYAFLPARWKPGCQSVSFSHHHLWEWWWRIGLRMRIQRLLELQTKCPFYFCWTFCPDVFEHWLSGSAEAVASSQPRRGQCVSQRPSAWRPMMSARTLSQPLTLVSAACSLVRI